MSDKELKLYRLVRVVGQEQFEAAICGLMNQGYLPTGGVTVMEVVHPITGASGLGFLQAVYRPAPLVVAQDRAVVS